MLAMSDVERRQERVRIETMAHSITGTVTLARDGYRSRLSDLLNASERDFVTLTQVTLQPHNGSPDEHHGFMAVGRSQIVFAVTEEG